MAKFLKGNGLNFEIEKIFDEAENKIIIISPYIQLHDRFKSSLRSKLNNPNLEIFLVFGKNEEDLSKSIKKEDIDFFIQFPNIKISYEKRLHAKYYANEYKGILTSMNLYGFSQNNNIEAGVLMEFSLSGVFTNASLDLDSEDYFKQVFEQAELIFHKTPNFKKGNLLTSTKYLGSEIVIDKIDDYFRVKPTKKVFTAKQPVQKTATPDKLGYCIRSGKQIPFNIERPLDDYAFKMWSKYKDVDYTEKYCHFSGELSDGKTSVKRPILAKNWRAAKEKFNL